jgi:large subunit ribosomal protein L24
MEKIRKGDTVIIAKGKDRGKSGKVIRIFPRTKRLIVEGIALQSRHRRPRKAGEKGQRVTIPGPIAVGNVRLLCPSCGKATRVGFQLTGTVKQRVCKKCGATIP